MGRSAGPGLVLDRVQVTPGWAGSAAVASSWPAGGGAPPAGAPRGPGAQAGVVAARRASVSVTVTPRSRKAWRAAVWAGAARAVTASSTTVVG